MRKGSLALAILLAAAVAHAQEMEAHEKGEAEEAGKNVVALAAAMKDAKVSLTSALQAGEAAGTPISGKFEIEDGRLQLSVYAMKGDKFYEVVVDPKSGKVVKTEPITGGDDLAEAKEQAGAMAKTKRSLREVVAKVEKANAGYVPFRVEAELEDGTAQAAVSLLKGGESKEVEERL